MFNSVGFNDAVSFLIFSWCFFVVFGIILFIKTIIKFDRPMILHGLMINLIINPILMTSALFSLFYTFVSFEYKNIMNFDYWRGEINNGYLALRITGIFLTYQMALAVFMRFAPSRKELIRKRHSRGLNSDDVANFMVDVTDDEKKLWKSNDISMFSFYQFLLYLIVLSVIWISVATETHNFAYAILSWALLFVVDDWANISDYCYKFNVIPIKLHAIKINFVNVVLIISSSILLYQSIFGMVGAFIFSVVIFFCVQNLIIHYYRAIYFEKNIK